MDILSYIQRINQLYGSEPLAPRYNTQQYLQGGRVEMKPGGLVEPRVGFDKGGMASMIAHLKTLKSGAITTIPELMVVAKQKGWKIAPTSLSRMLHDIDAKQKAASGNITYMHGEARRNEIKEILKNITVKKAASGTPKGYNVSKKNLKKYII